MKKNKTSKKNKRFFLFNRKLVIFSLVAIFATFVLMVSGVLPEMYRSSVMSVPKHADFDGTTYPIKKVPDWVKLTSAEWTQPYDEFKSSKLIDTPAYSAKTLLYGTDNDARNAKTTYSVVYMGNYRLDHIEGAGSHLAVDIKIPIGTPVYAIANGTVIKASTQNDGFGHHIVLQHNKFPTLENKKAKETLYSSYSHLSKVLVSDRDIVNKGDLIGYSGATGTATTPHLHFQIDNDNAPWHPFWPFTWQDVRNEGLDFFSAINAGLGQSSAYETTVHPMEYVQKYMGGDAMYESSTSDSSKKASSYVNEDKDEDEDKDENENSISSEKESNVKSSVSFLIDVDRKYYLNKSRSEFSIFIKDFDNNDSGNEFTGSIALSSENGFFKVDKDSVKYSRFDKSGTYYGQLLNMKVGKDRLVLKYDGKTYYSDSFEIISRNVKSSGFADVDDDNEYRDSIMYLASKGVVQGYSDGTFKPTKQVTRAEALKLILEGSKTNLSSGNIKFPDVDAEAWYVDYIYTANKRNIVSGYPDGTFRPNNTVTKSEFLKILLGAMKIKIDTDVKENPYTDVGRKTWFAPYFVKAKELGLFDETDRIQPSDYMTRQEIADAIYRVMQL
ncbi:MAG: S-layer homology domain-containing protein [Candidatus Gracilibacteria bacterium]|nr:S-layer homology domain-containing protein [Candidatus Gracilibacteria bacterium]